MLAICWDVGLLIFSILKCCAAKYRDSRTLRVHQITTNATTESALQRDPLLRALQKCTKTRVEPVIPGQQVKHVKIDGVSSRNRHASTGRKVRGEDALSSPALANI